MNIKSTLEIHFHQQDEGSVFLENTASGEDEKFGEILLLCLYITRTFSNFGNDNHDGKMLALFLHETGEDIEKFKKEISNAEAKLIEYNGHKGRKYFTANLTYSEDSLKYWQNAKGFGIFAKGIGYYAPNSIIILLRYLMKKRSNDNNFIEKLQTTCMMCSSTYNEGNIKLTNQHQVAFFIASAIAGDNVKSDFIDQ